jgi:DNA-binding response OmpR family regulator
MTGNKPLNILIVEDNPGDAGLVQLMLAETDIPVDSYVAANGRIALDNLLRSGKFSDAPKPDLVILDLNLPKVHGFDVLFTIKSSETLRTIPVVILTGSLNKEDERRARTMGVADYLIKPVDAAELDRVAICLRRNLDLVNETKMSENLDLDNKDLHLHLMGAE